MVVLKSWLVRQGHWHHETFRFSELPLNFIESGEFCNSQMEGGGNVKYVSQTKPRCESMGAAQSLSPLMHGRLIHRNGREESGIQIDLKVV